MRKVRLTFFFASCLLLCSLPRAEALDLFVSNVPDFPNDTFTTTVTPQIDNLGSLKRYHLRDSETAEALMVSCWVGVEVDSFFTPLDPCMEEPLPATAEVTFCVRDMTGTIITSVTRTYAVTWQRVTGIVLCGSVITYAAQIPSTPLPLAGLDLEFQDYFVSAEVDPTDSVLEDDEGNNFSTSDDNTIYFILSGLLNYGPVETELTTAIGFGACIFIPGVAQFPMTNTSMAEWTHEFGTTAFNLTTDCYFLTDNTDGFSLDANASSGVPPVIIGTISGTTPSGLEVDINGVFLDEFGAHMGSAKVHLPDSVSVHLPRDVSNPPKGYHPCGDGELIGFLNADFVNIYDLPPIQVNDLRFYHGHGLPFVHHTDTTKFEFGDTEGIRLENALSMHCHYPTYLDLHDDDPRSSMQQRKGFPTNDVVFMGYNDFDPHLVTIEALGINAAEVPFLESIATLDRARTSFPQTQLEWNKSFTVAVKDNVISEQELPVNRVRIDLPPS